MIGLVIAIIVLATLLLFFIITSILLSIAYTASMGAMQKVMKDYIELYRKHVGTY